MKLINSITDQSYQVHFIKLDIGEIQLVLRYHNVIRMWCMDVFYANTTINGVRLSLGVQHINRENLPFDFIVIDNSNIGLDPYRIKDFSDARVQLYMLEADDMEVLRGRAVQV